MPQLGRVTVGNLGESQDPSILERDGAADRERFDALVRRNLAVDCSGYDLRADSEMLLRIPGQRLDDDFPTDAVGPPYAPDNDVLGRRQRSGSCRFVLHRHRGGDALRGYALLMTGLQHAGSPEKRPYRVAWRRTSIEPVVNALGAEG